MGLRVLLLPLHVESLERHPCSISHKALHILQPVLGQSSKKLLSLMERAQELSCRPGSIYPAAFGDMKGKWECPWQELWGPACGVLWCALGAKPKKIAVRFSSLLYPLGFCSPGNEVSPIKCCIQQSAFKNVQVANWLLT